MIDLDTLIKMVFFLCGALFLCTTAILVYVLLVAFEIRRREKALKEHPKVIREWIPQNGKAKNER